MARPPFRGTVLIVVYLMNEAKAAELKAAELKAAEDVTVWPLSKTEKLVIENLTQKSCG